MECPDAEQRLADLQRRFELAVEDVRELKTKNAQLETQLAQASTPTTASSADGGAMDWEAQKQRLLASLEGEGTDGGSARQEERATIEGTISITDEVVAEKDNEIAALREQITELEAASGSSTIDCEQEQAISQLVDADEVIQQHRDRIAQLETEMEQKLREAELELIARRANLNSTVLKVAHHGSATSTNEEFLAVANPRIAVISVGEDNPFGHPTVEVLDRLQNRLGVKNIYRTDKNGTIDFITDGKRLWVEFEEP